MTTSHFYYWLIWLSLAASALAAWFNQTVFVVAGLASAVCWAVHLHDDDHSM